MELKRKFKNISPYALEAKHDYENDYDLRLDPYAAGANKVFLLKLLLPCLVFLREP